MACTGCSIYTHEDFQTCKAATAWVFKRGFVSSGSTLHPSNVRRAYRGSLFEFFPPPDSVTLQGYFLETGQTLHDKHRTLEYAVVVKAFRPLTNFSEELHFSNLAKFFVSTHSREQLRNLVFYLGAQTRTG